MPGSDCVSDYLYSMGKLIVNLQSLEFALRAFLYGHATGWQNNGEPVFLENIAEGQSVEENAFTNYDSLSQLAAKYNGIVRARDANLQVDKEVIRVRDALVHGRIAGKSPSADAPQRLVKYDRPQNGIVKVIDSYSLAASWFSEKIKLVHDNIERVPEAIRLFNSEQ